MKNKKLNSKSLKILKNINQNRISNKSENDYIKSSKINEMKVIYSRNTNSKVALKRINKNSNKTISLPHINEKINERTEDYINEYDIKQGKNLGGSSSTINVTHPPKLILKVNSRKNYNSINKEDSNNKRHINNITNINIHIYNNNKIPEIGDLNSYNEIYENSNEFKLKFNENLHKRVYSDVPLFGALSSRKSINTTKSNKVLKLGENDINKNILQNNIKKEITLNEKLKSQIYNKLNSQINSFLNNSLPDLNVNNSRNSLLPAIKKNNKLFFNNLNNFKKLECNQKIKSTIDINSNGDFENNMMINTAITFLKNIDLDKCIFCDLLNVTEIYFRIELNLKDIVNYLNNNQNKNLNKEIDEKIKIIVLLINEYFKRIQDIMDKTLTEIDENFFSFYSLYKLFYKIYKLQIVLLSCILINETQFAIQDFLNSVNLHFYKIIKDLTSIYIIFFHSFIQEDLKTNYSEFNIKKNLKSFYEFYNIIYENYKVGQSLKNSETVSICNQKIEKCISSIKYYVSLVLKYSTLSPFGEAVNQVLSVFEKKNLIWYIKIFSKSLMYGELTTSKVSEESCIINKRVNSLINEVPPYLPPISKDFEFTLVLDMDETLIHYFCTKNSGMFFVRPYCFNFLNELSNYYEIVTFTAGTKEYADKILDQLDYNGKIIKYRLYRDHTSIMGNNVLKDLTKLGRDLSKIIIVDNLKENFKLQPNNGLFINTWTNDILDCQFRDLLKVLKDIVILKTPDVRSIIYLLNLEIQKKKNFMNPYSKINIKSLLKNK